VKESGRRRGQLPPARRVPTICSADDSGL
jgi:hypothetical protein